MKLDTTAKIVNLNGEPIKDVDGEVTVGKIVAGALANSKSKSDPIKLLVLAERFYREKSVDLDEVDLELVNTVMKDSDFVPLIKGQILRTLKNTESKIEDGK